MHVELKEKNINLLVDFDSTFVTVETIDEMSKLSCERESAKKIEKITIKAMEGKISFQEALSNRIKIINANKNHVNQIKALLKNKISPTFRLNKKFIINNADNFYIISGGFKEIIFDIVKDFGIKEKNVFANDFIYDKNSNIININTNNPLSKNRGKVLVSETIKGYNIAIGDGFTDFEIRKFNKAKKFIQYIETINRKNINNHADFIAKNFNEAISYINSLI